MRTIFDEIAPLLISETKNTVFLSIASLGIGKFLSPNPKSLKNVIQRLGPRRDTGKKNN
jgi:hypothetical protein